jgi:hypothetical protein
MTASAEKLFEGYSMGHLTREQLIFLWGYALERGHLKLGPYHEIADEHGADRVETMLLAFGLMDEMPDDIIVNEIEALPPPPPWPFKGIDLTKMSREMRHARSKEDFPQSDR